METCKLTQELSESKLKSITFSMCVDIMKDYAAHNKFLKKSKLRFGREIPRSKFPKGLDGWLQWRIQFTPQQGEDTTMVQTALKELYDQRKLSSGDYTRLQNLYGFNTQTETQPNQATNQVVMPTPQAQAPSPVLPTHFCPNCGAPVRWIEQYQRWYCDKEQKYP
jgi:hypothetical protein